MSMSRNLVTVATAVTALVLGACTSSPTVSPTTTTKPPLNGNVISVSAVDTTATPAGWVPVDYGDVQISVPASFGVYYPGQDSCRLWATPGALFLGPLAADTAPRSCTAPGYLPATTVDIVSVSVFKVPSGYVRGDHIVLNGILVYPVISTGPQPPLTHVEYYAPSLGVVVTANGPMATKVTDTLTRSPRTLVLASGPAPAVPSSWRAVTFAGLRFSVPRSWVVKGPCTWALCGPGPVALYGGVFLDTDQRFWPQACPPRQPPEEPRNGVIVEGGDPLGSEGSFSTGGLCIHISNLTACPATSPAYSILVLKVTVPGRSKPVYVSLGLAGNGMVAKTILYSLRPATEPAARAEGSTDPSWWVTLAFADSRLGAVVDETGSEVSTVADCNRSVYTTSDGGKSWTAPLLLSGDASCSTAGEAGGATDEMAMTADGTWFLATAQGLYRGRVGRPGFKLLTAGDLLPAPMFADTACQVAASGKSVWVVLALKCGQSNKVLLYSDNDGEHWTGRPVPLDSVVEGGVVTSPPDGLVVEGEQSAWLLGWSNRSSTRLAVARTTDGGRSWYTSRLPCKSPETISGLLTVSGNRLLALCLGWVSTGFGEMAVVTSSDGGATWTRRCNNGPQETFPEVGSCPEGGYPVRVVAMPNEVMLSALDSIGGVYVSLDSGRAWKPGITTWPSTLTLSKGTDAVWVLGTGTFSAGEKLAVSTNGRTWRQVALP
ncbi:MAG: hypothetical protein ABSD85_15065 [Acidimicrobiales bacterium]